MQPSGLQKTLKFCVITICVLCLVWQIWNEISLLSRSRGFFRSIGFVTREVFTSAWLRAVVIDFLGGSLFAALYIYVRRGPPLFGMSVGVVAVLCILFGSFFPLLYIIMFLLGEPTLGAIAPEVSVDEAEDEEKWLKPRVVGSFFLVYFIFDMTMWAVATSILNFKIGTGMMFRNVFSRVVTDAYLQGIFVVLLLVVLLEGGNTWWALGWFILVAFLGNAGGCLYAFVTAWKAAREGCSFRKALLTTGKPSRADGVTLATSGQPATYSSV